MGSHADMVPEMADVVGVAEAKRRFSELLDRVAGGERIVIARRGKPAVTLVPPDDHTRDARDAPTGFAALAGALADWDALDEVVEEIAAARRTARDRPAPTLD